MHSVDTTAGTVEQIQHIIAPEGSDPRHLTVHRNGNWVYVVYEAASTIAVYSRDNNTGLLTDTNLTYSLLPEGKFPASTRTNKDQVADLFSLSFFLFSKVSQTLQATGRTR